MFCASTFSNKCLTEETTKCLFCTSLKSTQSIRTCFTVSGHWQVAYTAFRYVITWEKIKSASVRSRFSNTESRRDRHVFRLQGLMACSLFPAQQLHIFLATRQISASLYVAGSFIGVTDRESADFAAASAISVPGISIHDVGSNRKRFPHFYRIV